MKNKTFSEFYYSNSTNLDDLLDTARKWNIFATIPVILIGIIGHSLIILVFSQKRFRNNSNDVLTLCLAINDSLYLINHFFEDTLRTYKDIFIDGTDDTSLFNSLIKLINITDKFSFSCRLLSFLKYFLRFVSAYILVAITLQRLIIVHKPFAHLNLTKKISLLSVLIIIGISFLVNSWVPFVFELNIELEFKYCDVSKKFSTQYFHIEAAFVVTTILIPLLIIFITNLIIIYNLCQAETNRVVLTKIELKNRKTSPPIHSFINSSITSKSIMKVDLSKNNNQLNTECSTSKNQSLKPFYFSRNNCANRVNSSKLNSSKNSAVWLFLISSLFIALNLPYLINWLFIFYGVYKINYNSILQSNLFAWLQISEIIYNLNFTLLFYVYCLSGAKFRSQLKHSAFSSSANNVRIQFHHI